MCDSELHLFIIKDIVESLVNVDFGVKEFHGGNILKLTS